MTGYEYDALDRLTRVTYADTSTVAYVHDAGDRLREIIDSSAGTITREYDLLDRLTSETTPEGSLSYTYDLDGRRETMTVAGQPTVTYAYDDGHRLTSITQGPSVVSMTYDAADRRETLTLPNGIVTTYDYDDADQLTGLTYTLGETTLGTLTYTYDAVGNRTSVGGTWARTGLPQPVASATYDAANRIETWAGRTFSYDANGNLASDGLTSYLWNARDQLTTVFGPYYATFQYDGVGRRTTRSFSGLSTSSLYDGPNAVREISGDNSSAEILPGLAVDEWFTRSDAAGFTHLLGDALGSTVALVDAAGLKKTEYTYAPFGVVTTSGASSANPTAFTGREMDPTGLHHYRNRDYNPRLQRFLAEDPAEFDSGDANLYAYVWNSPTNWIDPYGLVPMLKPPGCRGVNRKDPWWKRVFCSPEFQELLLTMAAGGRFGGKGPRWGRSPTGRTRGASSRPKWKSTDALRQHNRMARDAAREAGLNQDQAQRLHREISGLDLNYQDILDIARSIRGGSNP